MMEDPFGDSQGYADLASYLKALGRSYSGGIKAILAISAHWEEALPTLHFGEKPGILYDYSGFPEFTYHLSWPAPGNPALASRIATSFMERGITSAREEKRGYDHGSFVPLMIAFPQADIPTGQLSLVRGLDPETHLELGAALESLRSEGVLIICSGMSYHNMRGFGNPEAAPLSEGFDAWLSHTVSIPDPAERKRRLLDWEKAPGARSCHPRSEHLVPLFIAAGAAGVDPGRVDYSGKLMGMRVSGHRFG